ncbi:hypothetical protein ALP06_101297, partial [Pseudomonas coronafaciens pv. atropurpurea]
DQREGQAENKVYYFHTDQIGTPLEMTDAEGQIVWQAKYKPWGMIDKLVVNEVEQNLRFQGQYFDVETGLHYNTFRTSRRQPIFKTGRRASRTAFPSRACGTIGDKENASRRHFCGNKKTPRRALEDSPRPKEQGAAAGRMGVQRFRHQRHQPSDLVDRSVLALSSALT